MSDQESLEDPMQSENESSDEKEDKDYLMSSSDEDSEDEDDDEFKKLENFIDKNKIL